MSVCVNAARQDGDRTSGTMQEGCVVIAARLRQTDGTRIEFTKRANAGLLVLELNNSLKTQKVNVLIAGKSSGKKRKHEHASYAE